ncbi:hypothetical protein BD289DRAFT_432986 [Coniella lustricola]|uniref:Uncharacterized protein n=1 Tax=Coniella lustricola TaxID=2025994 RepID=A0A2T3A916_9PEZI|nr:hypothetical protein BD289DRAFT_432986 [Coniella lustricola]
MMQKKQRQSSTSALQNLKSGIGSLSYASAKTNLPRFNRLLAMYFCSLEQTVVQMQKQIPKWGTSKSTILETRAREAVTVFSVNDTLAKESVSLCSFRLCITNQQAARLQYYTPSEPYGLTRPCEPCEASPVQPSIHCQSDVSFRSESCILAMKEAYYTRAILITVSICVIPYLVSTTQNASASLPVSGELRQSA